MSDVKPLVEALKRALRRSQVTYADVARGLGMSESNVKRLFSTGRFSLHQLADVCELAGLTFAELAHLVESTRRRLTRLTRAQEEALVADRLLLLAAVCVRNHWRMEDIVRVYRVTQTECIRLLVKLDRLRLIELLPGNRYRLLVSEDFQWIPDGPIDRFFEAHILSEFLDSSFCAADAYRQYLGGSICAANAETLRRKLKDVAAAFAELHARDADLPSWEKVNYGVVLALRPWELSEFRALRRLSRPDLRPGETA